MADAVAGRPQQVDEAGLNDARDSIVERRQAEADAEAASAAEEAARFLEENQSQEGVVVTASGLQYQVLKRGDSEQRPTPEDTVRTHYTGELADGSVFDSSEARGVPATFGVSRVIQVGRRHSSSWPWAIASSYGFPRAGLRQPRGRG